ncbi:MAG: hypothetical protein WC702_03455 [Patescibacteria group bacterium]|jgi:hypothetical protein
MSGEFSTPSPEEMVTTPFDPDEIRQSPDGKFIASLPAATMELDNGMIGIVGWSKKTFDSREEAEAAREEGYEKIRKLNPDKKTA